MELRVLILDDYQDVSRSMAPWSRLSDRDDVRLELDVRTTRLEGAALFDALTDADVLVAMRERTALPRDVLDRARKLRLLVTTGMANAAIDLQACRERGVEVRGTQGSNASTAELTWGLIIALARSICGEQHRLREGSWQTTMGADLAGARLGVVGLGRLGSAVSKVGLAFGMDVVAWSQNLTPARAAEVGVAAVDKATLFSSSDFVTLHLKLSERTRGVVGAGELAAMKPTAYLINTSRGPLVDEAALIEALRGRRIAGAGLDVYDTEPLPAGHPLLSLPNTVLTPHLGYVTNATYDGYWRQVVEDIVAWLDGVAVRQL